MSTPPNEGNKLSAEKYERLLEDFQREYRQYLPRGHHLGTKHEEKYLAVRNALFEKVKERIDESDIKKTDIPLARIKKIMKGDESVKMISQETPYLFAKAAELLILDLTASGWQFTLKNSRRTLHTNDIAEAVMSQPQFDFLLDVVRYDEDPGKKRKKSTSKLPPGSSKVAEGGNLEQSAAEVRGKVGTAPPSSAALPVPVNSAVTEIERSLQAEVRPMHEGLRISEDTVYNTLHPEDGDGQ